MPAAPATHIKNIHRVGHSGTWCCGCIAHTRLRVSPDRSQAAAEDSGIPDAVPILQDSISVNLYQSPYLSCNRQQQLRFPCCDRATLLAWPHPHRRRQARHGEEVVVAVAQRRAPVLGVVSEILHSARGVDSEDAPELCSRRHRITGSPTAVPRCVTLHGRLVRGRGCLCHTSGRKRKSKAQA